MLRRVSVGEVKQKNDQEIFKISPPGMLLVAGGALVLGPQSHLPSADPGPKLLCISIGARDKDGGLGIREKVRILMLRLLWAKAPNTEIFGKINV